MDDLERTFREGLRAAAAGKPPLGDVDLGAVAAAGARAPHRPQRWLALAAALAVVAGIGVWAWRSQPGDVPALPAANPTSVGLVGTSWLATEIDGQPVVADAAGDVPSLTFVTDLHGYGGQPCNAMAINYAIDGSNLEFKGLSAHDIGCGSSQIAAQQARFSDALLRTSRFRQSTDTLELAEMSGKVVLRFRSTDFAGPTPTPPSPTAGAADGLAGMRWVASNVGGAAVVGGTADRPWLEFSLAVDGLRDVSGSDGCHSLTGQSDGTADFINLTGWDLIVRPCGSVEHQQQQTRFVSALEAVTRFRVSGTTLRLMRADGTVALRFDGAPADVLPGPGDEPTPTEPPATRIFTPDPDAEENQVHDYPQVRYRNDSTATFERVLLKWSDGGSDSAGIDIQPGQYSGYVEMGDVHLNPYVRVSVKGKQYEWNPPSPGRKLTRGNVTYVLDIVDGLLTVTPDVQD